MDETLTIQQISQAFIDRIETAKKGKYELADAVRHCCENLPVGEKLRVADNTLRKVKAVCETWGGRTISRPGSFTKTVLLINGRLVDEPRFETEAPDSLDNHWPAVWTGPESGWYEVADKRKYDRLCTQFPEERDAFDPPNALEICSLAELSEVALAVPEAMSVWCAVRLKRLDSDASDSLALATVLRQQTATSQLKI